MDVTPTPKMLQAMQALTDGLCGADPGPARPGRDASRARAARAQCMDVLHRLVHLAMREGAARQANGGQRQSPAGLMLPAASANH